MLNNQRGILKGYLIMWNAKQAMLMEYMTWMVNPLYEQQSMNF